ncbi:glycoside hydrolase domain-containing protein [Streptomyces sp. HD]|uniref:glycoside hydrolase domain-containing protein n=1 Tax=Streptomyces sp. HD TaxID=3020892 RepID=UPI00232F5EE3|nr:glycoside hydrolase domain-containing protein [Streptomyces sp. HD]MDC0770907.1 DUF1906 domain-containing protein [Streptomyces sp. HD]
MPVTIQPRSTWAVYVEDEAERAKAAAPPEAGSPWEPYKGGVFIHYRGSFFSFDPDSEEDCKKDIAGVFEEDLDDGEKDIQYNFLICPHGVVYEGRGLERGEANGGDAPASGDVPKGHIWVDGYGAVGRNTAFYSICALLAEPDYPTDEMLRSYRDLIGYLRSEAPSDRRAGPNIFPHSKGYDTQCPGNLTMYAQQGSTIDPSVPWKGRGDIYVYAAQKWVNAAYSGVASGYVRCPETGYTGWSTVLSLTQGLQHELGISPTVQSYGPGTFTAVKNHNTLPGQEFNANIVHIYNSALWCKGYWTSTKLGIWNSDSEDALAQLYGDIGLSYTNLSQKYAMWPHVSKALLRMDQFRLVRGGDINIRAVQHRLNSRYVAGIGIPAMGLVPCDGIYSRDVQQGFMMAIQYEIGIAPASINGYFGPGTQAGLKGKGSATLSGDLRHLFRAACYFNSPTILSNGAPLMYNPDDIGTDAETSTHLTWLRSFQAFSQIPVTATNDYTTWAQLLVSSGDTSRPATGCDCITEITPARAQALKAAGYRIVGRYLDEHLPPSDPYYLGKALKPGEPQVIYDAGLRLFPIFQYNGTQLGNFTYDKGHDQGAKAHAKAVEHGIGAGACIYFAVDYDAMDSEIDSNVLPYFKGVRDALAALGNRYDYGVYGSRNVCIRVSHEADARWSFVSGMSWGFSGNLGYPLPANWSLNQIREYEFQPGWGLDHNVWRDGGDPGVSRVS